MIPIAQRQIYKIMNTPLMGFSGPLETNKVNEHNKVKNLNWQEANQFGWGVELGTWPRTSPPSCQKGTTLTVNLNPTVTSEFQVWCPTHLAMLPVIDVDTTLFQNSSHSWINQWWSQMQTFFLLSHLQPFQCFRIEYQTAISPQLHLCPPD